MLTLSTVDLSTGITPADLAQSLVGPGISISNVTYTGDLTAAGRFSGGTSEGLGVDTGVMLSSGRISGAAGPNNSDSTSTAFGLPGDAQLDSLIPGTTTNDASILEFDFVATGSTLSFQYVFGSEEYNEFVNSGFNDVFAFFLNGTNVALIPGTTTPVSINNVNAGKNSNFFRNNDFSDFGGSTPFPTQADGFTVVLQSAAPVHPGTNHIKLAIADAGDFSYDSWVFLTAESFVSGQADVEITKNDAPDPVAAGDQLTYSLVVTNHGPDNATAVLVQDTLPAGMTFVSATISSGSVFQAGGVVTASPGKLAPGATSTITITVVPTVDGTITNTATVQAAQVDPVPKNNVASATTTVTRFKVNGFSKLEGDAGLTEFVVTVSQLAGHTDTKTIAFETSDGSALAGTDYVAQTGTLVFAPGETKKNITIHVIGDKKVESDESFYVTVHDPSDAQLDRAQGTITIINDDTGLVINDITLIEGNSPTRFAVVTVSTVGAIHVAPMTVALTTVDGTAHGGTDFIPTNGQLTFAPGTFSQAFSVPIISDLLNEDTETFSVVLSNPTNAEIVRGTGIVTIIDDDPVPALYVDDVQLTATQAGLAAVFSVGLDVRSGREVTVQYATSDFTAHDGVDYLGASGTLTFAAGVNTLQVTVPVMTDPTYAPNEQFYFDLSNPVGATVADGHGVANIVFAGAIPAQYILDDGEAGYQQNYGWTNVTNLAGYHMDYDWHPAGTGVGFAQWGLSNLPAGDYQVFTRWVPFTNRATNAPYTILDGANVRGTVLVNQQIAPAGDRNDGVTWQSLGTFPLATGTLRVRLSDNANGYVVADAVRIVPVGIPPQVPEIDVASASHSIAVGDDSPSADDGTDFGTITAGLGSVTHTFTISNTGNADLHLLGTPRVQISGADAGDFSVVAQPDFTVAAGRTTTFQVKFQPTSGGPKQATLSIASDDADEGSYNFDIAGNADGVAPLAHNAVEPLDVNDDQMISARDALIVINALIKTTAASGPSATPLAATETVTPAAADALYYIDVDGDGLIAPHDALLVINYLIHHPPTASPAVAAPGDATPQVQAFATTDEAIAQLTSTSSAPAATPLPASTQSASTASQSASQTLAVDAATAAFDPAVPEDNDNSLDSLIG